MDDSEGWQKESGISMMMARYDDDDDDLFPLFYPTNNFFIN